MREPAWRRQGQDPDYRFSLANERTFLAWIRTALAILASGVVLDQLPPSFASGAVVTALAIALCALGAGLSAAAFARWRANEIAMRHGRGLGGTAGIALLSALMFGLAAFVGILLAMR